MNIQQSNTNYFPEVTSGTCHLTFCGQPGVVIARDVNVPGFHFWMCEECWAVFADVPGFVLVQDTRERQGEL